MNMLIIGNGFDLAHNLPTKYKDFLDCVTQISLIVRFHGNVRDFEKQIYAETNKTNKYVKKYLISLINEKNNLTTELCKLFSNKDDSIISQYIRYAKDNFWIKWFSESSSYIDEGWIDFEAEISRVVQSYEVIMYNVDKGLIERMELSAYDEKLQKFVFSKKDHSSISKNEYINFHSKLKNDLNNLMLCLELYLKDCVQKIEKTVLSPDIYNLSLNYILSFNYTDTFERLYGFKNKRAQYDFIHGRTQSNAKDNNMVLGIDEYLQGDECNSNISNIEFKKYYQRIHKKTGCKYKNWLAEISKTDSKKEENNVYIYGHSLSKTDGDVLREIILNKNVTTTVYYYDMKQYGEQISHLVQVLGQDKLIEMVYSNSPRIKFVQQHNMVDKDHSEWQIMNDINSLYRLHMLLDSEIKEIISRVTEKIKNKELKYFYNQRNVIELYDLFVTKNIFTNKKRYCQELLAIAEQLYSKDEKTYFNSDEWLDADYSGVHQCDINVMRFINQINEYNSQQDSISDMELLDLSDDLSTLVKQISQTNSVTDEQFENLFYNIFNRFSLNQDDAKIIWDSIFLLSSKIEVEKWRDFVHKQLSESKGINKLRFMHIQDVIDEEEYYESMLGCERSQNEDFDYDES